MRMATYLGIMMAMGAGVVLGCANREGVPPDESLARVRKSGSEYSRLGKGTPAETWEKAAYEYYPPADLDYFEDMDGAGATDALGVQKFPLGPEAVKGRNAWVLWAGGNEAWWDWLARYGYGTIDLLKLIDSGERKSRFTNSGLMNEPGTREPTEAETKSAFGVRYARPVTEGPDPSRIHVEHRKDRGSHWKPADPKVYGYPSGVVGLRLFPNPQFKGEAKARWNPELYYSDSPEGREYAARPDTIRPFRIGMSCGFCHIAPHPLNPPDDPNAPVWANLSNNVGNQFMRIRAVFGNVLRPDNYLYHVFDSQLPGAVDTSGYPSDNNNNPNTINSFYGLRGRLARAENIPTETIGGDSLHYLRTYIKSDFQNPHHVPRVLLDGSDSVGVHIALARVYLNIGTHHQQWIRVQNPLLGFRKQDPFKLHDVAENSLYWHAIRIRVNPLAAFFTAATDPMRLKDVARPDPAQKDDATEKKRKELNELLAKHLRGTGLPWYTAPDPAKKDTPEKSPPMVGGAGDYLKGREVFAKGCIACHSSVQPGDLPELEALIADDALPRPASITKAWDPSKSSAEGGLADKEKAEIADARRSLRLTPDDRVQLTRGDGTLPPAYARWAQQAVHHRAFWETVQKVKDATGVEKPVTVHNFLSIDERIPVTITRTNSGRAVATNALHGHVWEDFASQTYKELPPVGAVRYRDPFSGAEKVYTPPGGGLGYYRVPTLISIWATAPLFHNNSLGTFNNDPSVAGRLEAFDDAIDRLLWPEKRRAPSKQWYWDGQSPAKWVSDASYLGRQKGMTEFNQEADATARRDADGGWIWRTTEECSLQFSGPHVPTLVGGVVGISPGWMKFVPWVPSIISVVLGIALLWIGPLISLGERIGKLFPWLVWLSDPFRRIFALAGFASAAASYFVVFRYMPLITLLDVGTHHSIWNLRLQAFAIPLVLFGSFGLIFLLHKFPAGQTRARVARYAGLLCLVLAVVTALGFGRFLAGHGAGVRLGPIPEGVPVNVLANFDPEAPLEVRYAALNALTDFLLKHQKPGGDKLQRRLEFEERVAPVLLNASKCPDFITDRGHDYEFIRRLTDEEKRQLKALLKTF